MPVLASLALLTGWAMGSTCPGTFLTNTTTVGAITSSSTLSICVSRAQLISGSNGSLTLVIGGSNQVAPRCLIYPNGLSPDLTFQLLQSGHVGCWSLYPPGQSITIVNVGVPSVSRIQSALKQFKPEIPRILVNTKAPFAIGSVISFSSTAKTKKTTSKLLSLSFQVRFKPVDFSWELLPSEGVSSATKFSWKTDIVGVAKVSLKVGYSVEYLFTGLTSWRRVQPNIIMSALPVTLLI
ncbi:MAG: hypothetical protein WCG32_03765, partial [Actinomycetes bacterium]